MVKIDKIETLLKETSTWFGETHTRVNNYEDIIEMLNSLPDKIDKISATLVELSVKMDEILTKCSMLIKDNNQRLVHFNIDMMKILFPQMLAPTKTQLRALIIAMTTHGLGDIEYANFEIYTKKLWNVNSLKQ
jgi:hypothetical protein